MIWLHEEPGLWSTEFRPTAIVVTKMVIEDILAFPLHYPEPHDSGNSRYITVVKVIASSGLVGWGECICQFPEAALATKVIIDAGFAPLLKGEDPRDTERLWQAMRD